MRFIRDEGLSDPFPLRPVRVQLRVQDLIEFSAGKEQKKTEKNTQTNEQTQKQEKEETKREKRNKIEAKIIFFR